MIIIIIINNRDRKSLFKSKKGFYKPTRNSLFKLKKIKIKKSLYKPAWKNLFKSNIEEIKEIILDPIINRDEKIEEIKKILYNPRNNHFKPKKDHYRISSNKQPQRLLNFKTVRCGAY